MYYAVAYIEMKLPTDEEFAARILAKGKSDKLQFDWLPAGTILVGNTSSDCNNCGGDVWCWSSDKQHDKMSGYIANGYPGCGIEFTHITSTYAGDNTRYIAETGRPDLEYVDFMPLNMKSAVHPLSVIDSDSER